MTQRQESSRGLHKKSKQARMDIESAIIIPEAKKERIQDNIYTLFDDDFTPSTRGIKEWINESYEGLESYFARPSKQEDIKNKKLTFIDGIRYFRTILLSELLIDHGKYLEKIILEYLAPLVEIEE